MLDVRGLSVRYGQVEALTGADFRIDKGEIVALLGPNGAGKSSALKAVSGVLDYYNGRVASGTVEFDCRNVTGLPAHKLISRGMAVLAEGRRVFHRLTVRENLEMGGYLIRNRKELTQRVGDIFALFPKLKERSKQQAGTLSGGEQQMLVLGRALITKPRILLADEPSVGLSPNFVENIFEKLVEIARSGVAVLMAEQNARMALQVSDRAYVFGIGRIEIEGSSETLRQSDEIRSTFFGA